MKLFKTGTFCLLIWLISETVVIAQNDSTISKIYLLNEVAVIGQRFELNTFDRYNAVALIDNKQIRTRSPMSMPEALSYIPGIWMQKTNHGGGSPFIRGLTGYQVLILIDGIRLNNSTFRYGPNQYLNTIDLLNIRRIEAIRGSGSVQYGSDAIGGTVLIMSKKPEFSKQGFKVSGDIYGKVMSSGIEKSTRAEINLANKTLAVSGGFTYSNKGDIKAGGNLGKLTPTGYDEFAYDFKANIRIKNNHELTLAYQYLKQNDVPLYHKIISGNYEVYSFDPQQRSLAYIRLSSYYSGKIFSKIKYTLSYQNSFEGRNKQRTGEPQHIYEEDKVKTYAGTIDVISNINKKWKATSGLEYYHDYVSSKPGLYPDGSTATNLAAFSLHNLDYNKWNISLGIRYNMFEISIPDSLSGKIKINPSALVGNVGLLYKLTPKHHLVSSVNSAFRAPNINDVSSFGIADFRYEIPNYDLQSEKSYTIEIGWKTRQDKFSAAVYGYRNKLTDLMTNVPSSYNGQDSIDGYRVYRRENINKAVIWGAEVEMDYSLSKRIAVYGNVFYTYGKNISKNEPIRRIPPHNGKLGIRYDDQNRINARVEWAFALKQSRLSIGDIADDRIEDGGTPGWNTVDISLGYFFNFLDIYAGIKNLINEEYRVHGSGVDGIGRCFWISGHLYF